MLFSVSSFIIILIYSGSVRGAIKTWADNTNYDNPNNWNVKRIPCQNDRVIFPADGNLAVYMPKLISAKEIILPNTGLLIFPSDGNMVLSAESAENCPGQDVTFVGGNSGHWYDSDNWNVTSPYAVNLAEDKHNLPIPHSEQIPCDFDDVVFPPNTTFRVKFHSPSLEFNTVSINGMMLESEELSTFMSSETGKKLFIDPPEISIQMKNCAISTGCACKNDQPSIIEKICQQVSPKCSAFQCADPIKPIGHCCWICGSKITAKYTEGFSFDSLGQLYLGYVRRPEYYTVQSYLSKTHDNKIQMVFTDAGKDKGLAKNLAKDIHEYLKQDLGASNFLRLAEVEVKSTSEWYTSSDVVTHSPYSSKAGLGTGGNIGIVLTVLIVIIAILILYLVYKKKRITGFSFARFDSGGNKIEMELGTTPHEMLEPISSGSSAEVPPEDTKGFDNPMYEKSGLSLQNPSYKEMMEKENVQKSTDYRENPIFMVLDDRE